VFVLLRLALLLGIFDVFLFVFVFKMDRAFPGKALKTLNPSEQTLKAEARTLKLLFLSWREEIWVLVGTKLPLKDWAGFRVLKGVAKVRSLSRCALFLRICGQASYLLLELITLRPVMGRRRVHWVNLVRVRGRVFLSVGLVVRGRWRPSWRGTRRRTSRCSGSTRCATRP